jgi:hypothetical protein
MYEVWIQIRSTRYEIPACGRQARYEVRNTLVEELFHRAGLPAAEGSVYFNCISIVFHFKTN